MRVLWLDTHHPIPHPGFRIGQVWSTETEDILITYAAIFPKYTEPNGFIADNQWVFAPNGAPYGGWTAETLIRLHKKNPTFLMHDPIMPDLAPWAPVET